MEDFPDNLSDVSSLKSMRTEAHDFRLGRMVYSSELQKKEAEA
jgi:hypothetical protein